MTKAYDRLKRLLGELFQFDRADLDFGVYRIMNYKREEVSSFLDNDLLPQVREAFDKYRASDTDRLRERLVQLEQQAQNLGIPPTTIPEYGETQARIEQGTDLSALKDEVYSDLYTFFRRYYKDGDFLSLRRYKEGAYAIPYEGEEVKLHWANADQYYIKTTESFRDYRFQLPDGRYVHLRLAAASTERDNNKVQNGKERRFVLREELPVEEVDGELNIYFEYRPHTDNQKTLNEHALERILGDPTLRTWEEALREPMPTQGNPQRTMLEKHLGDYTARNSFDYFIHKDLGRFLRRELDFYLKNEVLHVDDLDAENADRAVQYLAKLGVIRQLGHKIIAFLAQIEDFQKRLFEKKKFVVQADYCLTIDNVPEELYLEIAANEEQYAEWERLFTISEILDNPDNSVGDRQSVEWLKANPYLVLDTKFFNHNFKDRLLSNIENLDEEIDGLLVESENFQALNLLQERYREQVKCIYIDPPYNTGNDEFIYKDSYQHSSWLAMLDSRLPVGLNLLSKDGLFTCSLDDTELANLNCLIETSSHDLGRVGEFVWKTRNTDNRVKTKLSVDHEYIFVYGYPDVSLRGRVIDRSDFKNPDNDLRGPYTTDPLTGKANAIDRPNLHYTIVNPETGEEFPPDPDFGWITDYKGYSALLEQNLIYWPKNPRTGKPRKKRFLSETDERAPISSLGISIKQGEGNIGLSSLFGSKLLNFPKPVSVMRTLIDSCASESDTTLDFFAGSGTTGHAVIDLNREDGGDRRYVLVEMGEYFDTVLKPRIQKIIYSMDWRNGKPVSRVGTSHIFKYLKLESYEDTLNNIILSRNTLQQELVESDEAVREEYMLSYMLNNEASGSLSLLNSEAFEEPFAHHLKVIDDNETRLVNVDMVETFNYLLGLTVDRLGFDDSFRTVEGTNPQGERVLVIWRTLGERSNADLDKFFISQEYGSRPDDEAFDRVYVNGDNNLENLKGKGERWRTLLIEEEFRRLMFGGVDSFGSLVGTS